MARRTAAGDVCRDADAVMFCSFYAVFYAQKYGGTTIRLPSASAETANTRLEISAAEIVCAYDADLFRFLLCSFCKVRKMRHEILSYATKMHIWRINMQKLLDFC